MKYLRMMGLALGAALFAGHASAEELTGTLKNIKETGAINLGAVLAAVEATGMPLNKHRVVIFGAGTAGIGVADQLRDVLNPRLQTQ